MSRLAWTAYNQSDSIIVGRMLGESALGSYRVALNLASAPAEKIGTLVMRVTGPMFAKVQEKDTRKPSAAISKSLAKCFPRAFFR